MFRKPKKIKKAGIRRRREDDQEDNDDLETTRKELQQARKKTKSNGDDEDSNGLSDKGSALHYFTGSTNGSGKISHKDLATSTNEHHPTTTKVRTNKFLAGPIRAATNIRTTCRFDYQPDICKDYKDTGFCGFGDTCIYLHDRGDTMSGWQIEQKWEEEQKQKKQQQQDQLEEFMKGSNKKDEDHQQNDGLPFACHICRNAFTEPVITNCGHYFCQACLLNHIKTNNNLCPVCSKDTHGVFHQPTKLLAKKRRMVGKNASWQEYLEKCQGTDEQKSDAED